jgi:DNA repair protein RadA/Sms
VVACLIEGTRPILVEIQALISHTNFGLPRRTAVGTDYNRVNLLMAVIEKRIGVQMGDYDAYVNIAGGMKINEPALDLALVMALLSSFKNRVISADTIVFGEVGLAGEIRAVSQAEQRVLEARKLGFQRCILPAVSVKSLKEITGIELIGVNNIKEAEEQI